MSEAKEKFDLMGVAISGIQFVMPKAAAMALFETLQGVEIYRMQTWYPNSNYNDQRNRAFPMEFSSLPTLIAFNPVIFHTALINQEKYEAEERAKAGK